MKKRVLMGDLEALWLSYEGLIACACAYGTTQAQEADLLDQATSVWRIRCAQRADTSLTEMVTATINGLSERAKMESHTVY